MGSVLTKVAPLKDTKDGVDIPVAAMADDESSPRKFLDPRSPNPFRTPISNLPPNEAKPVLRAQNLSTNDNILASTTVTPTKLKAKLLRDLGYTLDSMDPRSPEQHFNRTPITFDESIISEDFSLTGLSLNESKLQTPVKEIQHNIFSTPVHEDGKFADTKIDPRSPSIDIERTPLTLNALLADAQEIENSQSTVDEVAKTPTEEETVEEVAKTPTEEESAATVTTGTVKSTIYMDENQEQPVTPNVKSAYTEKIEKVRTPRTPLSCLVNTQSCDNRKMHNKTMLARTIFKDTTVNHNTNKMNNSSSSKIPVLRKSLPKEIN